MKSETLEDIVASFDSKRILIVGDVMLDEYIWGGVSRISPEAPVPVVEIKNRTFAPGGAANVAANVASFLGRAFLGGVIGKDTQGTQLRETLVQMGIDTSGLFADVKRPTTTKTRVIAHHQQVVRIDLEHKTSLLPQLEDKLLQWIEKHSRNVAACIVSDYAKGVVSRRLSENLIRLFQAAKKPIVVDPKGTDYVKYKHATVVTPNVQEAVGVVGGEIDSPSGLLKVGRKLLNILEGSAVLITRGAEGMSLFQKGKVVLHVRAVPRHVFDVTGAGDTVVSVLGIALAAGVKLEWAAELANLAANIVVGKVGTATVTMRELLNGISDGSRTG